MNVLTQTLKRIVDDFGIDTLRNGKKTAALFVDLVPQHKQEQTMLRYLIQCGGNTILLDALHKSSGEQQVAKAKLIKKMMDDCLVSQQAATVIFDSFWTAIGGRPIPTTNTHPAPKQPPKQPLVHKSPDQGGSATTSRGANNGQGNSQTGGKWHSFPKSARGGIIAAIALVVVFAIAVGTGRSHSNVPNTNLGGDQAAISNKGTGDVQETEYTGPMALFEMPVTCEKNVTSGAVNSLYFSEEETDVAGYRHQNCYKLCADESTAYIGYDLNGKYKTLSGKLYAYNEGEFRAGWLDFYDGESFLFSTEKVSAEAPSTSFCIDISGVDNLVVYFRATDSGTWMIAEDFNISRDSVEGSVRSAPVVLFNLPIYSEDGFYLTFDTKVDDSAGNIYVNTYLICASPYDHYVRYDLGGKYTTISGAIHTCNGYGDAWLDFYDGDNYLFSTKRVGPGQNSATFSFDISGVQYLTVYSRSERSGEWIVAENIVLN